MKGAANLGFDERFLVLAPTGRDATLTAALLEKAGVRCDICRDMGQLCDRTEREGAAGLLIAEETLGTIAVGQLADMLARQESWSDVPILLFTGNGASLHARPPTSRLLTPLGNVTLLDRPLRPLTMVSATQAALRARHRQYAARGALLQKQRAVQQRDEFLAMLGHELRNPLGAILMAVEMMERTGGQNPRHRAIVRHQASHLTRLVDDLLDVSRVTSGKIILQHTPVSLAELLQRCLQSMDASIKAQRLRVSLLLTSRPLVVMGDQVRLEQVVVNLVTNAIKYTPAGGQIEISLEPGDGEAVLRFQDSGVGIAADMLPTVFDLFAQVQSTLDRAKGGMGIGLTLVRSLVELHGGSVDASSPGLGHGSVFTVRLPVRETAMQTARDGAPVRTPSTAVTHDVLIVEDNTDSRDMLQALLEQYGHRVDAVGDGLTAVERALASKPGILVVDIGLPGLDGYGVARQVRDALGTSVYLVALTGYGQPDDRRRALEAGFDVHLTKPVNLAALRALFEQADPRPRP